MSLCPDSPDFHECELPEVPQSVTCEGCGRTWYFRGDTAWATDAPPSEDFLDQSRRILRSLMGGPR